MWTDAGTEAQAGFVLGEDLARNPEAKTGAEGLLRGEERLPDAGERLRWDAATGICDEETDVAVDETGADANGSSVAIKSVDGVCEQIGENLFDLALDAAKFVAGFAEIVGAPPYFYGVAAGEADADDGAKVSHQVVTGPVGS